VGAIAIAVRRAEGLGHSEVAAGEGQHDPFVAMALAANNAESIELAIASWDLQSVSRGGSPLDWAPR
jgi:hypothetical protein